MNKDFWRGFLAGLLVSLFVIYSFFRLYWILEVGVKYFRWHAVLWLYLFIAAIFIGTGYLFYKYGKLKNPLVQKLYLGLLGLLAGFYLAEIFLRVTGTGTMYSEQREGLFIDPAERTQKTWYMTWQPHETRTLASGSEYSFLRTSNNEGLSDKDWATKKDTNEIRIMTLGDSFTEGDGAPYDSSYPRRLEVLLQKEFPSVKINVMNAARIGSDPWFEYKKLHDRLLKYQPDIVVYTNGSNDLLYDHLCYGGMERFLPDSTVKNKIPHHRWMGLYEVSYVFRLLVKFAGYDYTFFGIADRDKNKKTAIADSHELSRQFSKLAMQNDFICIQLIRADKQEVEDGHYEFDANELLKKNDSLSNYSTFDLLSYYRDSLQITDRNYKEYFWRIDGHHNAKGYEAMAKAVASYINPFLSQKIE